MKILKKNFSIFLILMLFILGSVFYIVAKAISNPPMFTLTAEGGQGTDKNEFYVGRCFRVNINLHTNGQITGGADAIINYNNNDIKIVQSDCSTSANSIYPTNLYDTYVSNSVSSNKITLSGYENPGGGYANNSLAIFGYFYAKVLNSNPSYNFTFDYTPGSTADTNIVRQSPVEDIINSVENLNLIFKDDTDNPYFTNLFPANNAINIPVDAAISYTMNDDQSGVDRSTAVFTLNSVAKTINTSCNANNISCNASFNSQYLPYNQLITLNASVSDFAVPSPHSANTSWSFTTENDTSAPYLENFNPAKDATRVPVNSNISFNIKDYKNNAGVIPGLGIDLNTLSVVVDGVSYKVGDGRLTYSGDKNNYLITIDPVQNFQESTIINVSVSAKDLAQNSSTTNYSFTTIDTQAPFITDLNPAKGANNISTSANISFHIKDIGTGVNLDTLSIKVDEITYIKTGNNQFSFSGNKNDYAIIIDPKENFKQDQVVIIIIKAQDFDNPANSMKEISAFSTGSGCPACDSCCPACP